MNKFDYFIKKGREGAEKRWENDKIKKLDLIQQLYVHADKKLIDWLVEGKSTFYLKRLLNSLQEIKHDGRTTN